MLNPHSHGTVSRNYERGPLNFDRKLADVHEASQSVEVASPRESFLSLLVTVYSHSTGGDDEREVNPDGVPVRAFSVRHAHRLARSTC